MKTRLGARRNYNSLAYDATFPKIERASLAKCGCGLFAGKKHKT
jgi:hypothetical protein